jgi:hypothetical protein
MIKNCGSGRLGSSRNDLGQESVPDEITGVRKFRHPLEPRLFMPVG